MRHIIVLLALCWSAWAGTYTAATCSRADVDAVINGPTHTAVDGDVIQIPAGGCTWTSGITVSAGIGITIKGAGTPSNDPATTGASASCTQTVLIDNLTGGGNMFHVSPTFNSSVMRLSCMKIAGDPGLGTNAIISPIALKGTCNSSTCAQVRLDNITFDSSLQAKISNSDTAIVSDNVFGVLDHNRMTGVAGPNIFQFINYNNSAWNGVGGYGDNDWATASSFGTAKTLYLENNSFEGSATLMGETESAVTNGGQGGGRIAARFNYHTGPSPSSIGNHGTESNGRARGGRQIEYYGNTVVCTNTSGGCQGAVAVRSGVNMVFGNSLTTGPGSWFNQYVAFVTYRTLQNFAPWGTCDGTGAYDNNDGTVYASGTVTSVSTSGETVTITDTTKIWSGDQWIPNGAPYALRNTTRSVGAQITGNGTSTVSAKGWTAAPDFQVGDSYQILRASACIDQPNRSGGTLLSGFPTPSPTGAINQSIDPTYEWNNSGYNPVFGNVSSGDKAQIANRDWFTDNSNGTPTALTTPGTTLSTGVKFGTKANRPTSCTTGVAYWATDEGNWNLSGNAFGQGNLYKCTSTDTWTLSYTPYTYPHPLQEASPEPPSTTSRTGGASRIGGSGRF
jgi:hypothetical protein